MCLYFLEQLGSGHSRSTGDGGGLEELFVDGGIVAGGTGNTFVFFAVVSSSPARLFLLFEGSGRGGMKGVGEAGAVGGADPLEAPRRPLTAPPFLSLLCTEDLVSVKLLRSVLGVAPAADLPRFPRPFGVRVSRSLVGESQNLGGAQSCLVQSSSVPTYVFPRQVTFTTRTPPSVSCQTMPSKVTLVPGSQGPKQSGSVIVPTLVPTQTSFVSLSSVLIFLAGGGDELRSSIFEVGCELLKREAEVTVGALALAAAFAVAAAVEMGAGVEVGAETLACSGLAADPVAAAGLAGGPGLGPWVT